MDRSVAVCRSGNFNPSGSSRVCNPFDFFAALEANSRPVGYGCSESEQRRIYEGVLVYDHIGALSCDFGKCATEAGFTHA